MVGGLDTYAGILSSTEILEEGKSEWKMRDKWDLPRPLHDFHVVNVNNGVYLFGNSFKHLI